MALLASLLVDAQPIRSSSPAILFFMDLPCICMNSMIRTVFEIEEGARTSACGPEQPKIDRAGGILCIRKIEANIS
jgi:hypothetical protein